MRRFVKKFLGLFAVGLCACSCGHLSTQGPASAGPSLRALAGSVEVPAGFKSDRRPAFFNRENLFEAIDGMAPEYISYGCRALAALEWTSLKSAEVKIEAHIYDMESALGAFGIYSRAHVGEGGEFLNIGEEAAVAEDSVEFARGQYYVKLSSTAEGVRPVLESAARAIVPRIPAGPKLDELIAALPAEGRVARSERWVPDAAFGMEFMRDVLVARYKVGDKTVEIHRAPFNDDAAAKAALEKFRAAVTERSPQAAGEIFPGFAYADQWMGRIGVFAIGPQIMVVVGYEKNPDVAGLLKRFAANPKR